MNRTNVGAGALATVLLLLTPNLYAECNLYDLGNFGGSPRTLAPGERLGNLGRSWDNRTSSINMTDNCKVTIYADPNFKGESKTLTTSSNSLGSLWDNQASSAVCSCTPPADWNAGGNWHHRRDGNRLYAPPPPPPQQICHLYRDADFQGGELALSANMQFASLGYGMDDQTSSVKVPQGCSLTVYSHEGLDGRSRVFQEGDYNFVGEMWDDRISSAQCACR